MMDRWERAKQFMPFDALKGLHEALRQKEYEHDIVDKPDLSEEKINELTTKLNSLKKNTIVEATYYMANHNHKIIGPATLDTSKSIITVATEPISLSNLIDLKILPNN